MDIFLARGLNRALWAEGDAKLGSGHYDEAETLYLRCLSYHHIPEARLRLALCYLYKGNAYLALRWDAEPDPIEWPYLIVALLCCGKLREATARANQFQTLCHPE